MLDEDNLTLGPQGSTEEALEAFCARVATVRRTETPQQKSNKALARQFFPMHAKL